MKNYLVIQNDGLIHHGDLMLIGSSTKRNDSTKIGMFGSGWKYALAYLMRNKIEIKIFSGKEEINLDTSMVLHRNNPVEIITINGEKSSLTTEMGPKWNGWMTLREIISNAIDEGGYEMITLFNPKELPLNKDKTTILIESTEEIHNVISNYEKYFSFNRKPDGENEHGKIFHKKLNTSNNTFNFYRKGIRCINSAVNYHDKLAFDFDANDVEINESRLVNNLRDINDCIKKFIEVEIGVTKEMLKSIFENEARYLFLPHDLNEKCMTHIKSLMNDGYQIIDEGTSKFADILGLDKYLIVTDNWYKKLLNLNICKRKISESGIKFFPCEAPNWNINEFKDFLYEKFNIKNIQIIPAILKDNYSNIYYHNYSIILEYKELQDYNINEIMAKILSKLPEEVFAKALK